MLSDSTSGVSKDFPRRGPYCKILLQIKDSNNGVENSFSVEHVCSAFA